MPLTNEDIIKLRAWMKANPMEESDHSESESDSESDSDDGYEPVLGGILPYRTILYSKSKKMGMTNCMMKILEKIKLEQQSDASPPESAPKPEQSGVVDPAPVVATQACGAAPEQAEQIVPPPAPTLRRRCDRPGRKHQ